MLVTFLLLRKFSIGLIYPDQQAGFLWIQLLIILEIFNNHYFLRKSHRGTKEFTEQMTPPRTLRFNQPPAAHNSGVRNSTLYQSLSRRRLNSISSARPGAIIFNFRSIFLPYHVYNNFFVSTALSPKINGNKSDSVLGKRRGCIITEKQSC